MSVVVIDVGCAVYRLRRSASFVVLEYENLRRDRIRAKRWIYSASARSRHLYKRSVSPFEHIGNGAQAIVSLVFSLQLTLNGLKNLQYLTPGFCKSHVFNIECNLMTGERHLFVSYFHSLLRISAVRVGGPLCVGAVSDRWPRPEKRQRANIRIRPRTSSEFRDYRGTSGKFFARPAKGEVA